MVATGEDVIDLARAEAFASRFVRDLGVAFHVATVLLGDRLGFYQAMADGRPVTAAELAETTGTSERHVGDWLVGQAAAGYLVHDPSTMAFRLPPEHAIALIDGAEGPSIPGAFQLAAAAIRDEPMVTDAFRTGAPVALRDRDIDLFVGRERFARSRQAAYLTSAWIPALHGVEARLHAGICVAVLDCGQGSGTVLVATAYPSSTFVGFDEHAPSIDIARRYASSAAGLRHRVSFEHATVEQLPVHTFELVVSFDTLHGAGDADATAAAVVSSLLPGGTWIAVEPSAGDSTVDPSASAIANAAVLITTAGAGAPLGTRATEQRIRTVTRRAGFLRCRRIATTTFDAVYDIALEATR